MTTISVTNADVALGGTTILRDLSLTVESGTRTALVGPSGSGKSTLLRLIGGFEQPARGEVRLDGRLVASATTFVPAHRRGIAYVPQEGALFPHLTARGNIAFALARSGRQSQARSVRVGEMAELVGLDPSLLEQYPYQLSGGQQQRVALARALAPSPGVVLLDEPFSALDTGLREATRTAVVDALDRTAVTCVLVTHDQKEALEFGDQVGVLSAGRLVDVGAPVQLFDAPRSLETALFLGAGIVVDGVVRGPKVTTALGELSIGQDRRITTSESVRALVRPEQVALVGGPPSATVEAVDPRGASTRVTVRLGDGTLVAFDASRYRAALLDVGSRTAIAVEGSATIYSA